MQFHVTTFTRCCHKTKTNTALQQNWKENYTLQHWNKSLIFRSTPPSQPNKLGLKCPSARPSTKSSFDFNEIWLVGRGRRVMHDRMQYNPIQGQGQGHEHLKVGNSAIFFPNI